MSRRVKGKQLAKHLQLTGSLSISGSDLPQDSAALNVQGTADVTGESNTDWDNVIDAGVFAAKTPESQTRIIIP